MFGFIDAIVIGRLFAALGVGARSRGNVVRCNERAGVSCVARGAACGVRRPAGAGRAGARKECVVFASGETNAFKRRGYTMAA